MNYFDNKRKELDREIRSNINDITFLKEENKRIKEQIKELNNLEKNFNKRIGTPSSVFKKEDFVINLSDETLNNLNTWIRHHESICHPNSYYRLGDCEPTYSIHIEFTSLGRCVDVVCNACSCSKNIDNISEKDFTFQIESL